MQRFIIFAVLTLAAFAAQSQVIKCTDPRTGRVTFSDSPCEVGQKGVEVLPRRTPEEIEQDRQRADEANARRAREQAEDRQRAADQAAATAAAMPPPSPQPTSQANSNACVQAQRELDMVAGSTTGNEEYRRNRINAATVRVNAACGLQTEMIQPPSTVVVPPRRRPFPPALPQPIPPPIPQGPRNITGCDGPICRDAQGGIYHRNGPNSMTGPHGAVCHQSGAQWICN